MKKIFSIVLFDNSGNNIFKWSRSNNYLNFLKNITLKDNPLYVIDLRKYYIGKILDKSFFYKDKKVKYYKPKNLIDLYNFSKKKIIYANGPVNCTFETLFIFILLKLFNFKLVYISLVGFYLNVSDTINKKNYLYRIKRLKNIFFRFLAVVGIIPKISFYFESSENRIKKIYESFSKKFDRIFFFFKISYFQKIYRINSFYYNEILNNNLRKNNKHIVLIDTGLFHPGVKDYGFKYSKNYKKYYLNLYKFLHDVEKNFSKKIIFCIHPKAFYHKHHLDYIKKNFILSRNADKDIWKAFFVFFTGGSSLANKSIVLEKPFFHLISKFSDPYNLALIASLKRVIKINKISIEKADIKGLKLLLKNKLNYKIFIQNNLIYKKNIFSEKIIKQILFNEKIDD